MLQHVRRYASEAPKSGGNNALYLGLGGAALLGGGYYAFGAGQKDPVATAKELTEPKRENVPPSMGGPPDKVFIGGGMDAAARGT